MLHFPHVLRTRCEFVAPCRFGETLALDLEPLAVGRSSIEARLSGSVAGAPRFRVRHKTAMMSLQTMRAVELPAEVRARAERELASPATQSFRRLAPGKAPRHAFRSRQLVRYAHCDPGERVYFARFFDMFNAVLEDWFAEGLGCPWGTDFMVPPRDLRAPSLAIDAEFLRACVPHGRCASSRSRPGRRCRCRPTCAPGCSASWLDLHQGCKPGSD